MTTPRVTRNRAIDEVGFMVREARRVRDSLPVEEAARQAYTPTGPSIAELERMIRAQRGLAEPGALPPKAEPGRTA